MKFLIKNPKIEPPKVEKNNTPIEFPLLNIKNKKHNEKIRQNPAANPSIPSNQFIEFVMETIHIPENIELKKGESIMLISPKYGK